MAKTDYSKRIQSKLAKGKGTKGKVQRKPDTGFQASSPDRVTQDAPNSSSRVVMTQAKCFLPRKLKSHLCPKVLWRSWSQRHQTLRRKAGI